MAGTGVTVKSVLPGPTLSEGVEAMLGGGDSATVEVAGRRFIAENRPGSLIRRLATVDEVASLVIYVPSPQAAATTGAALRCDGGVLDTL